MITDGLMDGLTLGVVKSLPRLKNKNKKVKKMKKVCPDPPPHVKKIFNFFF